MSAPTATATLPGSVHGVVVQTRSLSPGSTGASGISSFGGTAVTGNFT